jgi:hypothetical protein
VRVVKDSLTQLHTPPAHTLRDTPSAHNATQNTTHNTSHSTTHSAVYSSSPTGTAHVHSPDSSSHAEDVEGMQRALLALKEKQKDKQKELLKKKNAVSTVAFGASSPTLRNVAASAPTSPPTPETGGSERNTTPSKTESQGGKKADYALNGKMGIILKPTTTDRWRAKTRGYVWKESGPSSTQGGKIDSKNPGVKGRVAPGASTAVELSVTERLSLWTALLVLNSAMIACESAQSTAADLGLHEPLTALLRLSSCWASVRSLNSSPVLTPSTSVRHGDWRPSQYHLISAVLATSCAFTSSSPSKSPALPSTTW